MSFELDFPVKVKKDLCDAVDALSLHSFLYNPFFDDIREDMGIIRPKDMYHHYSPSMKESSYRLRFESDEHRTKFILKFC